MEMMVLIGLNTILAPVALFIEKNLKQIVEVYTRTHLY